MVKLTRTLHCSGATSMAAKTSGQISLLKPSVIRGAAALLTGLTLVWPDQAVAEPVSATGKGIVGGALLGAEVTIIGEAIAGVEQPWLFAVGGALGAAAGGTAGYFIESDAHPRVSVSMLMGGMALSIPTLVVYLDATRHRLPAPSRERTVPGEPEPNPPDPEAGPRLTMPSLPLDSNPVVQLAYGRLEWNFPDVSVGEVFTRVEQAQYALPRVREVQFPLLTGRF